MLYRNQKVPVPDDAHPYIDGMVRHYDRSQGGGHNPRKTVIGRLVEPQETDADGKSLMHPNDRYFLFYGNGQGIQPASENRQPPALPSAGVRAGLYALVLGIAVKSGIYPLLCDVFQAEAANAVMDLVLYFLLAKRASIRTMADCMQGQLLFSLRPRSDTWYSGFLAGDGGHLTREHSREFMARWVRKRVAEGLTSVLCCTVGPDFAGRSGTDGKMAEENSRSGNRFPAAGAIQVVEAEGDHAGMPLAYFTGPETGPDAVWELAAFLKSSGLKAERMISDRGLPAEAVLSLWEEQNIPWLVMLKNGSDCFSCMVHRYGDTIRNRYHYRIAGKGLRFGITEDGVPLSGGRDGRVVCAGLFFDALAAAEHLEPYVTGLDQEIRRLTRALRDFQAGPASARTSEPADGEAALQRIADQGIRPAKEYEDSLTIVYDTSSGTYMVEQLTDAIEARCRTAGFFCMASDRAMTAQEMSDICDLRLRSDLGFRLLPSQSGSDAQDGDEDLRSEGAAFCRHVAGMIRSELVSMCRRYSQRHCTQIDADTMLEELNLPSYVRLNSHCIYTGHPSDALLELLLEVGVTEETLQSLGPLADAMEKDKPFLRDLRMEARSFPAAPPKPEKRGRPKGSRNTSTSGSQNHRGRKKGSKNRKTLAREAAANEERERRIAAGLPPEEPKPKRGRKKGSKNRKTLEREAAEAAERERRVAAGLPPEEPKVHKGRAKGTKNRKTLEREAALLASGKDPSEAREKLPAQRTGCSYRKTRLQEERDRELSEKTGIDIIGEEPPRPWTNRVRYQVNRERAARRKLAQTRLAQMENPDPSLT